MGKTVGEYGNGGANSSGRAEYIWLPNEDGNAIPSGMFRSNKFYAIHTDHLGTPRLMTDDQAKPVWQRAYRAFGDNKPTGILRVTTNPAAELNLRFLGQYWDSESNLAHNHFRSYRATDGRYTQPDPIGLAGGWNQFTYVEANALLYFDPFGLDRWGDDPSLKKRCLCDNVESVAKLKRGSDEWSFEQYSNTCNLRGCDVLKEAGWPFRKTDKPATFWRCTCK